MLVRVSVYVCACVKAHNELSAVSGEINESRLAINGKQKNTGPPHSVISNNNTAVLTHTQTHHINVYTQRHTHTH